MLYYHPTDCLNPLLLCWYNWDCPCKFRLAPLDCMPSHDSYNNESLCVCPCVHVIHEIPTEKVVSTNVQSQIQMKTGPHTLQRLPLMRQLGSFPQTQVSASVCVYNWDLRVCVKQGQLSCVCFNSWTKHIWCNTSETGGNHNTEPREFRTPGEVTMVNIASSANTSLCWVRGRRGRC